LWFHFGKALCEVIMPEDFYKVGPSANRQFDELGLRALERDWAVWPGEPCDDMMQRSQFNLFYDIGVHSWAKSAEIRCLVGKVFTRGRRTVPF